MPKQTDNDQFIWALISQTADIMFLTRDAAVKPFGITAVQAKVLAIIHYHRGLVTVVELARRLVRRQNGVSALITRMMKEDLVYEESSSKTHGKKMVGITDKGLQVYNKINDLNTISRVLAPLTRAQRERIIRDLMIIRDSAIKELHTNNYAFIDRITAPTVQEHPA